MKIKTRIEHKFNIEEEEFDFNIDFEKENPKQKIKITEVKRQKFKKDASTRLF